MRDRIFQYLERRSDETVALLQRIVRVPTVNPPGACYAECTELLAAELARLGLKTRRRQVPRAAQRRLLPGTEAYPRYNVIGLWDVGAPTTLHFNCHYDVVPASGGWRFGPFEPSVENGRIYGRGTGDMKGAIASVCAALDALRATGARPRSNIEVSFTADEETDSRLGAEWVARHGRLRATHAIICEAGSGNAVCCGHNGCLWFHVHIKGRSAHGSTPEAGVNAFEAMAVIVRELEGYKERLHRRVFEPPAGKPMRPTVNFGGDFGGGEGGKVNTVPGFATFTVDRRLLPNEDPARAEAEFRRFVAAAARRVPRARVRVERFTVSSALFTPPDNPLFQALAASIRAVRRTTARPEVATGFNDMHFFNHHLGIPVVGYGPLGSKYHAIDESAPVRDLTTTAKVYADLMLGFAG